MRLGAARALLPSGWAENVEVITDERGLIQSVTPGSKLFSRWEQRSILLPGMANVHSHAFQRAMAGMTEARGQLHDTFWTWRELMYRFAARITPQQVRDIAAHLYVEMLKAGYTSVAEFHYLHRDPEGRQYTDRGEMSQRLIAAADEAGIFIAHLPVLYAHGGFGGKPPTEGQKRFILSVDEHEALVMSLRARFANSSNVRIGIAFHSLRAVNSALMGKALAAAHRIDPSLPVHIHVAEQRREVEECVAWSGKRPVEWLLDHVEVDERWCLVHATHLEPREIDRLAGSGAVAGICPTTEANLGDGIFPASAHLDRGHAGRLGIGTDSHIEVSVAAELRLLEYGQRLASGGRAVLANERHASPGERLYIEAAQSGAQANGINAGRIAPGARADFVVLDPEHRAFWNKSPEQLLDAWIFTGDNTCVRDVMVGGQWRIQERRHAQEEALAQRFRAAQAALLG